MADVLMLCKAFPPTPGGVETFSEQVAFAYLRRGHDVSVVTQAGAQAGWSTRQGPDGDLRIYNTGSGGQLVTAFRMYRALRGHRLIKNADVVHATTWRPALTLGASRVPLILTVHGREMAMANVVLRPLMRSVMRRASAVVAVSAATKQYAREQLRVKGAENWAVAGNGISYGVEARAMQHRKPRGEPIKVLTFARLVGRKNVEAAIRSIASVIDGQDRRIEFKIAGNGPLRTHLETVVAELDLIDVVSFCGYVDELDIPKMYKWADIFLHPQIATDNGRDFEGFGLTIADAMSFGCVAVAGAGAGPSDFIEHGVTGYLVDGSDNLQIIDAVGTLMRDEELRMRIGSAGRKYVLDNLSWDDHARKTWAAFESPLAGARRLDHG